MPIVFDTSALLRPAFSGAEFKATKWESAEGKAEFANKLCRFVSADFKESLFTKQLYGRLSLTFGHIAHFNSLGFFEHFFTDLRGKVEFLEQTLRWWPCGDPTYTFCDVERAIQIRLNSCDLLTAYRGLRAAEVEGAERELLRRLQAKYDGAGEPVEAPLIHAGRAPRQSRPPPGDQQTLF